MIKAVTPHLRSSGRVINIGSIAARESYKDLVLYASSKGAVEAMTRALAGELGPKGRTINTVDPGPVVTELFDLLPKDFVEKQKAMTPLENRIGTIDDVSQVVGFLAEDGGRWVTGQSISVSGGLAKY